MKELFDGHTGFGILVMVRFWTICGRQDLGLGSAPDTLKKGRATFASMDGRI